MTTDLAPERHDALRDHFLAEITRPAPARRRSWLIAPIGAGAVAAAVAVAVALQPAATPHRTPAATLLEKVAYVSGRQPDVPIGAGQFVYIQSKVAWTTQAPPHPAVLDPVHLREIWLPQTGHTGLLREQGRPTTLDGTSSNRDTVNLPDEPGALLQHIYKVTGDQGDSRDGEAFVFIGDVLRESLMPARTSAALYRAAAKIPGVTVVPDAVDAAGRHGIAVAFTERGERTEWMFDKQTYAFLGERSVLTEARDGNPAGMVTATTAVLTRAVVDQAGQLP